MQSNRSPIAPPSPLEEVALEVALGAGAGLLVTGLVVGKVIAKFAQEMGSLSEEIFRGDRLPVLNFPQNQAPIGESDSQ